MLRGMSTAPLPCLDVHRLLFSAVSVCAGSASNKTRWRDLMHRQTEYFTNKTRILCSEACRPHLCPVSTFTDPASAAFFLAVSVCAWCDPCVGTVGYCVDMHWIGILGGSTLPAARVPEMEGWDICWGPREWLVVGIPLATFGCIRHACGVVWLICSGVLRRCHAQHAPEYLSKQQDKGVVSRS